MNLSLSKRGDYVLRSAVYLALAYEHEGARKLREVSDGTGIPRTFVSQIVGDLVHAGVAVSSFGTRGGYRLAHPPGEVTLLDVVEAGEGRLGSACPSGITACPWRSRCPLRDTWGDATTLVRTVLAGTTLAELAANSPDHQVRVPPLAGGPLRPLGPMPVVAGPR